MNEEELKNHIINHYPQENERCEWKEFKSLKHSVAGRKGDDVVTYISAILKNSHLLLEDILLLDKVQKHNLVTDDEYGYLKRNKFIEGRKNNFFLSYKVIEPTLDPQLKADYIKNRGLNDDFTKKYLYDYIKLGKVQRKDIEKFIWEKLPDVLDETKKKNKVKNLLQDLRKEGKIQSFDYGYWEAI